MEKNNFRAINEKIQIKFLERQKLLILTQEVIYHLDRFVTNKEDEKNNLKLSERRVQGYIVSMVISTR